MKNYGMRRTRIGNERGSVLVLVVMSLVAVIGVAALAIDLGMLYAARSEAQRAAEAGAHGGASALVYASYDVEGARKQARDFAERNQVRWGGVQILEEDIDVDIPNQLVRVRVWRTEERGSPVATMFARIFGMNTADVGAVAAAQSWPADGVNCILPLIMPDRWSKTPAPNYTWPTQVETFDPNQGHIYVPWEQRHLASPTGYGTPDRGTRIMVTMGDPNDSPQPGWYYPIRLEGAQGGSDFKNAITGCWNPTANYLIGQDLNKEPGNMVGPTRQGFRELISSDPSAVWNPSANGGHGCVVSSGTNECRGSSRIRPMVMFDPRDWPDIQNGAKPVRISNFVGVFVDEVLGNGDVYVRFMNYAAIRPASEWTSDSSLPRIIRIVE